MLSRKREDVQKRHQKIQRLRSKPRFSLQRIALAVGLADHSSVLHHLNGACKCFELLVYVPRAERCAHDWKCTKCGASG